MSFQTRYEACYNPTGKSEFWGNMEGHTLELRHEPDGLRYYLDGEGVHAGMMLVMILPNGQSQRVRFEWSAEEGTLPTLFSPDGKGVSLPEGARFR